MDKPSAWTREAFTSALHLGLGRALLYLRGTKRPERHAAAVLTACLTFKGYDAQVEGHRASYLFAAAQLVGISLDVLRDALVGAVAACQDTMEDYWDLQQRYELLVECALRGDTAAGNSLRNRCLAAVSEDTQDLPLLAAAVIRLDRASGLLFVLRALGRAHQADPGRYGNDGVLGQAQYLLGRQEVDDVLHSVQDDSNVRAYLTRLTELRSPQSKKEVGASWPYTVARRWAEEQPKFCYRLRFWGVQASDEQFLLAAQDVITEQHADILSALLCIFTGRRFPLDPAPVASLLDHPDDRVVARAASALREIAHPAVRAGALHLLNNADRASNAPELLAHVFQPGDEVALRAGLDLVLANAVPEQGHWFLKGLREVAERHPTDALLALLAAGYPHQPCSHCRAEMVILLDRHHALPAWLREEAASDASHDLRNYFDHVNDMGSAPNS